MGGLYWEAAKRRGTSGAGEGISAGNNGAKSLARVNYFKGLGSGQPS